MTGQGGRWLTAALAALLLCGGATTAAAFSFEEMDRIDQAEQGELLEAARKAAGQEDFDRAQSLIEQARNKRYAPQAVAGVEKLVREARAARDGRLRREEQARLAQAEAERRAREQASRPSYGYSGGGSTYQYQYSCSFCCEGQWGACMNNKVKVKTPATDMVNAQEYVRREYKNACEALPFYKGGGGSARVGYPSCD